MTFRHFVLLLVILGFLPRFAGARDDIAPAPRKMPRVPVQREALAVSRQEIPTSRTVSGTAVVLDSERIKINGMELRLFGVVPPVLSASYGPQARAALDALVLLGPVTCNIRDRSRDGRLLSTCHASNGADLALDLLKRGLAVTARGSLQPTELAASYQAAEQAAQTQKLGLWSVTLPTPASEASIREARARNNTVKSVEQIASPPIPEMAKKEEKSDTNDTSVVEIKTEKETASIAASDSTSVPGFATTPVPVTVSKPNDSFAISRDELEQALMDTSGENLENLPIGSEHGFFERYQLLLTGLLMLLTAVGVLIAIAFQKWRDRREEIRSIAAALRGELMAARAVCLARLNSIPAGEKEKNISWPRIRSLVFQAYVSRLGLLGAVLARQISSIYGQTSDYAAYYGTTPSPETKPGAIGKVQALQTLVRHMDEVLPKLVYVEQSGKTADCRGFIPRWKGKVLWSVSGNKANKISPAIRTDLVPQTIASDDDLTQEHIVIGGESHTASASFWSAVRKLASLKHGSASRDTMADHIPDYTALSQEERIDVFSYSQGLDSQNTESDR